MKRTVTFTRMGTYTFDVDVPEDATRDEIIEAAYEQFKEGGSFHTISRQFHHIDAIIALIGPSGCGKTTVAELLNKRYGLESVESYTTRPMRSEDETGHIFITEDEFRSCYPLGKHDPALVAYTDFNGYRYFATQEQVNDCDIYIIDPAGVETLKEKYTGGKLIITIWLDASPDVCRARMIARGDSPEAVEKRLAHDASVFTEEAKESCDHIINANSSPESVMQQVWNKFAYDTAREI